MPESHNGRAASRGDSSVVRRPFITRWPADVRETDETMFLHQCGRRSPPGIQKALRTTTQKYAAAHNRRVSLGVVWYSDSPSRSHRYRTRLIAALGPPSVSPKPQV